MAAQTEKISEQITESLIGQTVQVDSDGSVIRSVKLIGFESRNGRSYPPGTLKAAVHHYENVRVNLDHPTKPNDPRSIRDRIGVIKAARFVEGKGVYGDFHFNPKHPAAEQVVWDAQNNPSAVGFSHNASLSISRKAGKATVESIAGVRSMDLVADPATTSGFFESVTDDDPATEGVIADKIAADEKWRGLRRTIDTARSLMSDILYCDESKAVPVAVTALVQIASDLISELNSMSTSTDNKTEQAQDLKDLTVEQILVQRPDLKELIQTSGSPTIEELQQKVEQLETEKRDAEFRAAVEGELADSGLIAEQISDPFRKTLLATEGKEDRAALIEDRVALVGTNHTGPAKRPNKPRTTSTTEGVQGSQALTPELFTRRLRSR